MYFGFDWNSIDSELEPQLVQAAHDPALLGLRPRLPRREPYQTLNDRHAPAHHADQSFWV